MNCSRIVHNIDPILPNGVSQGRVSYVLEGATSRKGDGSASGLRFNAGRTRVTYTFPLNPVLECSFIVTIINRDLIIPDVKDLPTLLGNCSVRVSKTPVATNKCTGDTLVAITSDPVSYSQPGTYRITWRYLLYGQPVLTQVQTVIVSSAFDPDIDTLPDITGKCFAEVTTTPGGVNKCTNRRINAITREPLIYNQRGTYIINWIYVEGRDTIYRQSQRVIVRDRVRIIPDIDSLPSLSANCSITITKYPTAKNSCTDSVLVAIPLTPVKYDQPGSYLLRWRYIDRRDTLIQVQQLIVRTGRILPDIDTLPMIRGNCSVSITKYPTAKNSCTDSVLVAVPLTPVRYDQPGSYVLRWRYVDRRDTLIQVQQLVVQAGRILPDIDTLPVIRGNCSVSVTKYPTAKNSCTDSVLVAVPLTPVKYDQPGSYLLRWRYVDRRDTLIQVQQLIVQAGRILPDIDTLPVIRGNCFVSITKYPTAKNSCTDSVLLAVPLTPVKYDQPGSYLLRWRYVDKRDTLIQVQQLILQAGRLIPDIGTLPVITGGCYVKVSAFPTAKNPCTGAVISGSTGDPLSYDQPGNYFVRWRFVDKYDSLIQVQQVIVTPGTLVPDSLTLPVIRGCSVKITNIPTASNSCRQTTIKATTKDPLTYDVGGRYTIRWIYLDNRDTVEQLQQVEVLPGQLIPDEDTLQLLTGKCAVTVDKRPTASNSCNGRKITGITNDPLQYPVAGRYKINWIFDDTIAGSRIIQSQDIVVEDAGQLIPDVGSLPDLVADCSITVTNIPTATNSCNGSTVSASTIDPVIYTKPGKYTIHWTYTSTNQATVVQTQNVTITGNSVLAPEISTLPDLQGICSVVVSDVPLAKNKCNGNIIRAITNDPLVYAGAGTYKIRWIYVDGRDTVTQDQSVSIVSNGRLVADKQFLSPVIGDCEARVDKFPTATNSCSRKVFTATTSDPLVYSIPGTYSIRWTIREGANVIQQTQTVVVNAVAETIRVGPNPTRDEFRIIRGGCGLSQKISVRVYDIAGRLIEAKEYSVSDNIRFGAAYPGGSYVVQVLWGEKRFVFKLIKRP